MDEQLRSDFPIDWDDDLYVARREFLKFVTVASGGLALASVALVPWSNLRSRGVAFEPKLVARLNDIKKSSTLLFRYPLEKDLCVLIRRPDGSLNAFSQRCTHLSCPVKYQPEEDRLYCPCHNGSFSAEDGRVLQGPPPRPLPQVMLEIRGDEVWAVGIRRGEERT